jgi:hypothetical protein|eukprot:COSAG06_NODE_5704_length_3312_cov_31.570806_2_plen_61_part_00
MPTDPAKPTPPFPLLIAEIITSGFRSIDGFTSAVLVCGVGAWVCVYKPELVDATVLQALQ